MNRRHSFCRTALIWVAAVTLPPAACNDGPTQPSNFPVGVEPTTPTPAAPAPPPAPPAPPFSTVPWQGFVLLEIEADDPSGLGPGLLRIEIKGPPGATGTYPNAINDARQVVGTVQYGATTHAFLWSRETGMKDLGVLPGGTTSRATAINAAGQIAGVSSVATGANHAFRWSAETGMVDLGVSPGCYSLFASGINSNGDIVGRCVRDPVTTVYRPFVWTEARGLEDLGTYFGDKEGGASAINDRGQIAGFSAPESYYDDSRAVVWTRVGNAAQLGTCFEALCSGEGLAINSNGDVAGTWFGRGVVWRQGRTRIQLADQGGALYSRPTGINDRGQIVGIIYPREGETLIKAFSWTALEGLSFIPPVTGSTEVFVSGINNKGEIVGYSR